MFDIKKIAISLLCYIFFVSINLSALELKLKQGWSLISFPYEKNMFLQTLNKDIISVWTYKNGWQAYSSHPKIAQLLLNNNIPVLKKITPSQGVWVYCDTNTTLNLTVTPALKNDINLSAGWNLVGTIEDKTSINQIDPLAIFWKYRDGEWILSKNITVDGAQNFKKFDTISSGEGFWIYTKNPCIYKENKMKNLLFLDDNLVPQRVTIDGVQSSIDGFIKVEPFLSTISINDPHFKKIDKLSLDFTKRNRVIFLENSNHQIAGYKNSTPLVVTDFTLPDYLLSFYPIKSFPVEATVVPPLIMNQDISILIMNVDLKKSLTISLTSINTAPPNLNSGKFVKGFDMYVLDSHANEVDLKSLNKKAKIQPIFLNTGTVAHPYVYAKNGDNWDFVGPAIPYENGYISKNWYDKFTSYALVDVNESNIYINKRRVLNERGQVLRDVIVVSDNKISAVSNYKGIFKYTAPKKPKRLVAYKEGYVPQIIDLNRSSDIVLKKFLSVKDIPGLKVELDKNFKPIYTIGNKKSHFRYLSENYNFKPQLLVDTNDTIYTSVYKYNNGYVFGSSNSVIHYLKNDGSLVKLREGDGLIYDGFFVKNNTIYFGTFGDSFGAIDSSGNISIDNALSEFGFLDSGLSVVYKPLITNKKIYIPLYNQNKSTKASLYIKGIQDIATNNLNLLSNLGTPGKLSQTPTDVVFGTSSSKIVFVDKMKDSISKLIDFNGSGIIAEVVQIDDNFFVIDLNGTLKKFDVTGKELSSISLTSASNLLVNGNEIIVGAQDGMLYRLDSDLHIKNKIRLDSAIIAKPIIYKGNIYTITKSGKFYKNSELIGTFDTKVTNINLIDNSIVFGTEKGAIWKIAL